MANVADAPKDSFRLSMLLYDTRYRSLTIQVFVFFLFMAGAAWLVDNTMRNLEALGKDFDFGFLWNRAGYDISQRLVDYTNDSTHGRAMLVGLLNTLLIALLGCMAATVIGVLVGVLRLSRNWIVGRLMTVYVEVFRNVPLLLWILPDLCGLQRGHARAQRLPPEPRDRDRGPLDVPRCDRGHEPLHRPAEPGLQPRAGLARSRPLLRQHGCAGGDRGHHRGLVHQPQRQGARHPHSGRPRASVRRPGGRRCSLLVGLPVAVLLALGFHLEFPELRGFNFVGGLNVSNSFMALWLALSLYTGAFIAEIVRGASSPSRAASPRRPLRSACGRGGR